MSFWYLGSPYSKYPSGNKAAFHDVCIEAGRLILASVPIFCSIAHTHSVAEVCGIDPLDLDIWLPSDEPLMDAACGLIILQLPSWEISRGLQKEEAFFRAAGKPIIHMIPGEIPQELFDAKS